MKLCFREVTKSYGSNLALDHFTASLEPGIYALLGPNGSGKSTLMNILTDNLKADAGEITYTSDEGVTEDVLKMGVRFREKLGFMPQYPGLYPNFTVERFMWYMAALKGLSREKAKADIPAILAAVELDDVPGRKIGALSGGMKQRLALAQAVLGIRRFSSSTSLPPDWTRNNASRYGIISQRSRSIRLLLSQRMLYPI